MKSGALIVAMGIPACGKTTIMKELNLLISDSVLFLEAVENGEDIIWPRAVTNRDEYGYFGSLTWFRAIRVPKLFDAYNIKKQGGTALVDSYYDKIIYHYIGKKGLDWFFPARDPYFKIAKEMSRLDYETLPVADIIVFVKIDEDIWRYFYSCRNRDMDKETEFRRQCMDLQEPMLEACKHFANDYNKKLIIVNQNGRSVKDIAKDIYIQLQKVL